MHRVQVLSGHLSSNKRVGMRQCNASAADPNDIVVVHGLRTAIGRAKRGSFKVGLHDCLTVTLTAFSIKVLLHI